MDRVDGELSYQLTRDNQKISIVLPGEECLDQTGYKVMHNVAGSSFVCGYQSSYNGKVKLIYDISHYVTLESLLPHLSSGQLFGILCDMIDLLGQVYDIGFFQYENISFEAQNIFLEASSYKVSLIYVPVKGTEKTMSRVEFEHYFTQCVHGIVGQLSARDKDRLLRLEGALAGGTPALDVLRQARHGDFEAPLPTEDPSGGEPGTEEGPALPPRHQTVWERMRLLFSGGQTGETAQGGTRQADPHRAWVLVGVDTAEPLRLTILPGEFIVGKSPSRAQGVVPFNPTISGAHCKFTLTDSGCTLTDLSSTNGTFLSGGRLPPQVPYPVRPGDRIRLANSQFVLEQG